MLRLLAKIKHLQSLRDSNYVWIRVELTDKEKKFLKYFDRHKNFNKPELWRKCGLGKTQFYSYFHRLQNVYPESAIKLKEVSSHSSHA